MAPGARDPVKALTRASESAIEMEAGLAGVCSKTKYKRSVSVALGATLPSIT